MIVGIVSDYRSEARRKRAEVFRKTFSLPLGARVLDLGSEDGSHIHRVLPPGMDVYIADIDEAIVRQGAARYGYTPVVLSESGPLPFNDNFFDVVFCSSVIEHVTPFSKDACWKVRSGKTFRAAAERRQEEFAREIARVGKGFFVQTPNRWFPIESHSWAPGVAFLPRRLQVPVLAWLNNWWIKDTAPDWRLLTRNNMEQLFPDATLIIEKSAGLTKSILAVRKPSQDASDRPPRTLAKDESNGSAATSTARY